MLCLDHKSGLWVGLWLWLFMGSGPQSAAVGHPRTQAEEQLCLLNNYGKALGKLGVDQHRQM